MSDVTFPGSTPRSGYAGRRRSPGALAAAIALNGGGVALLLLMPATQYALQHPGSTRTIWIPLDPAPPEHKPDPVEQKKPLQPTTTPQPRQADPDFIRPPANDPFDGGPALEGGTGTVPLGPVTVDPVQPVTPPHVSTLVGAKPDPRFIEAFHPNYPTALQREGVEGSVTVRVTIDENGRVIAVALVKATDPRFFEETRDQALRRWRFRPATRDGVAIRSEQVMTVTFQLNE